MPEQLSGDDEVGPKPVPVSRISPPTCCTAAIFAATLTDFMYTELASRLIVRVSGRKELALLVVALRRSMTEGVGRIASPIVGNGWDGRYWR